MKNTGTPISPPERFPIGIIGGTGGMGRWFAAFFEKEGHPVIVSGKGTGPRPDEMAASCPVVIVSVPIGATIEVIRQVGPHMKRDSLLMDLTSLKAEPVRAMLESSVSEVIGLHPLFGPGVPSLEGQNVVLCPARGDRWLPWVRDVLVKGGANLIETTPERHDEIMAVVQALNHFDTIVLGLAIRRSGIAREVLEAFSTPLFRGKLAMIDRVFSHPELHTEIITANPHAAGMIDLYGQILDRVGRVAIEGNAADLAALMRPEEPDEKNVIPVVTLSERRASDLP
ncbi:MAG TPA: prephenate dehydrogenase/arogenate dehydrogenase family protein [Syntrophales bacterium]|nr:prephenate dehydrogenase/arogenate dehydrogenase family protein [Syntrophales bacterium]